MIRVKNRGGEKQMAQKATASPALFTADISINAKQPTRTLVFSLSAPADLQHGFGGEKRAAV